MTWQQEAIPNTDYLTRHCIHFQRMGKKPRRFPSPDHFKLRPGEEALSFNWTRYLSPEQHHHLLGITYKRNAETFLNPVDFKIFRYPVELLRNNQGVRSVDHDPVYNGNPAPVGQPNNKAHALMYYQEDDDEEYRLKLSDYCHQQFDDAYVEHNRENIEAEVQRLRERLNDTCYHRVENWGEQCG